MTAELQQDDAAGAADRHGSVGFAAAAGRSRGAGSGSRGVGGSGSGPERRGALTGLRGSGAGPGRRGLRRAPGPGASEGGAPVRVKTGTREEAAASARQRSRTLFGSGGGLKFKGD